MSFPLDLHPALMRHIIRLVANPMHRLHPAEQPPARLGSSIRG
jgi:hypothetical protein